MTGRTVTLSEMSFRNGHEELHDFNFELPEPESVGASFSIPIQGWIVGSERRATAIELSTRSGTALQLPVKYPRSDVAAAFPNVSWAGQSGFHGQLGAIALAPEFELEISALLDCGSRVTLGTIRGERRRLGPRSDARFQPIVVTALWRCGSTWLLWLLGRHPEIVCYRPYDYDARAGAYFAEVFSALAQPSSYLQIVRGARAGPDWWLGRDPRFAYYFSDPAIEDWLGTTHVEAVLDFCLERVDAFCSKIADVENRRDARHFVEKSHPADSSSGVLREIYADSKEIVMVRDFRDMLCSGLSFNARRGFSATGAAVEADEEYIRGDFADEVRSIVDYWRQRSENVCLLKYEDLAERTAETLAALLEYIGVDSSPRVVAQMLEDARNTEPDWEPAHRTTQTLAESVGRWSRDLDPSLQHACVEALGDALAVFGYET
jgi:hypothetical protein